MRLMARHSNGCLDDVDTIVRKLYYRKSNKSPDLGYNIAQIINFIFESACKYGG